MSFFSFLVPDKAEVDKAEVDKAEVDKAEVDKDDKIDVDKIDVEESSIQSSCCFRLECNTINNTNSEDGLKVLFMPEIVEYPQNPVMCAICAPVGCIYFVVKYVWDLSSIIICLPLMATCYYSNALCRACYVFCLYDCNDDNYDIDNNHD